MKIISVMNNKGGVLKTTLATNIAGVLAKQDKKVLLLDLDSQGNISTSFGMNGSQMDVTITNVLIDGVDINKAIKPDVTFGNLKIIHASPDLNNFTPRLYAGKIKTPEGVKPSDLLKNIIKNIKEDFDYMIIDCSPSLDVLSFNAIKASDEIIIPVKMEQYAVKGLITLLEAINVHEGKVMAIVPTLFASRTQLHNEMLGQVIRIAETKNIKVTDTKISASIHAASAVAYDRLPITLTNIKTIKAKTEYFKLVKELGL